MQEKKNGLESEETGKCGTEFILKKKLMGKLRELAARDTYTFFIF